MAPQSIFDPAPSSLPVRTVAGIVLLLLAGTGATVWGYLDSTEARHPAPVQTRPAQPEQPAPPPLRAAAPEPQALELPPADEPRASADPRAPDRRREGTTAYGSPRAAVRAVQPARSVTSLGSTADSAGTGSPVGRTRGQPEPAAFASPEPRAEG